MSINPHSFWPICFVFCISFLATSCKNESQAPDNVPIVQLKGTDCLKDTPTVFKNYANGTSSDVELRQFWSCTKTALTTFRNRVEGSDRRGYKATELRRFLHVNFLGNNEPDAIKINDELLKQFMMLKRLLIGGEQEWITYSEINETLDLIQSLQDFSIQLRPYILVLFKSKPEDKPDSTTVAFAIQSFESVLLKLGDIISQNKVEYQFSDLKSFLLELDKIYRSRGNGDEFQKLADLIPLAASAKGVLFSGVSDRIRSNEWDGVFRLAGHVMSMALRIKHYVGKDSLKVAGLLNEVDLLATSFFEIMTDAFSFRKDKAIPAREVEGLIAEYAKQFDLPLELTPEKAGELWSIVTEQVIPEYNTNANGFTLDELKRLESVYKDWVSVQFFLLGVNRPFEKVSIDEMKNLLSIHPLPIDAEGRIVFSEDETILWDTDSQIRLNLMRSAIGLVVQAFAADPFRRANKIGVSEDEFNKAYLAIKPILVLIDIVEEDDTTLGPRIFREADLFTPRANGDFVLNFFEVIEYAHMVLAGVDTGKLMAKRLQGLCSQEPNQDPQNSVNISCFRKFYRELFYERYSNMPRMVSYFKGLKEKSWKETLKGLEVTNREEGPANTPILNSDIYEMGVLMQYIEVIMFSYDKDRNGLLDTKEGLAAFPLFKKVIADILGADPEEDEKDVRALFTYMLRYGEPPNPKKPLTILRFLNWKWSESKWKFEADRGIILKILSSLSSS